MSRITREDVERTASLARLSLDESEIAAMTNDLDRILDHADLLQQLDTRDIEPTAHAIALDTPVREDRATPAIDPELAVSNAPLREGTAFVVPKVIDGGES